MNLKSQLKNLGVSDLSILFQKKELSPLEYTKYLFSEIPNYAHLNAFVTLMQDTALEAATASEKRYLQNSPLSDLDGIPLGIKDIIDVENVPTTEGCAAYRNNIAKKDAFLISTLRKKGLTMLAKTNTSQFALGPMGDVSLDGPCRNPHNPDLYSGGSSSGSSAAVAAHLLPAALGTDTGGSIRMPASLCGAVGLKPTFSSISLAGIMPLSTTLDVAGPITRSVVDNVMLFNEMLRYNPQDWRCSPYENKCDYKNSLTTKMTSSIVIDPENFTAALDPEAKTLLNNALQALKNIPIQIHEKSRPDLSEYRTYHQKLIVSGGFQEHEQDILLHQDSIYEQVLQRLNAGKFSARDYIFYEREKNTLNAKLFDYMENHDIIAFPTTPTPALPIGQTMVQLDGKEIPIIESYAKFTWLANISGFPEITLPIGYTKAGLPVGLSLFARPYQEQLLFQCAYQLEQYLLA